MSTLNLAEKSIHVEGNFPQVGGSIIIGFRNKRRIPL